MRLWLVVLTASLLAAGLGCGEKEESLPSDTTRSPTPQATASEPQTGVSPSPFVLTPTPAPGAYLWRWANVTLVIPETNDILVKDESTPSGAPGIRITRDMQRGDQEHSTVLINAQDGSIVSSEVRSEDREVMNGILDKRTVSQLDPSIAPWPYNGEPPPQSERWYEPA